VSTHDPQGEEARRVSVGEATTAGEAFRERLAELYEEPGPDQALVIDQLVRMLDEVSAMERTLDEEGMTVTGGNGQTASHPLIASLRQHRLAIAKLTAQLGLGEESKATKVARKAANARWGNGR
jgi:hypothetical protein